MKSLATLKAQFISVLKTVDGAATVTAALELNESVNATPAMANRIIYALDDAGFEIEIDGDETVLWKDERLSLSLLEYDGDMSITFVVDEE